MVTRLKICGLTRQEDVQAAVEVGAHAIGFVFEPTSPRYVGERWTELKSISPVYVTRVAVFGEPPKEYPDGVDAVQAIWTDQSQVPSHVQTIQTIRLKASETVEDALNRCLDVNAYLLDAYDPHLFGGLGRTVDWDKAAEFVARCDRPVILAGGLKADNVKESLLKVKPYAVDVSSGVEISPGVKDSTKMKAFAKEVFG